MTINTDQPSERSADKKGDRPEAIKRNRLWHIFTGFASVLFAVLFGLRNANQFLERSADKKGDRPEAMKRNRLWHIYQAFIQVLFFALIAILHYLTIGGLIQSILIFFIGSLLFWFVFEGVVNIIGLKQSFWYVGKTAFIDRLFQRFRKPELIIAIAKIALLSIFISAYFLTKLF